MKDDAVRLLLREVGGYWSMLSAAPDPAKAKALLVSLTLFRFDDVLKRALQRELTELRWREGWTPVVGWLTILMFKAEDDPASWPFCLSEREFEVYATQNFGNELGKLEGIYHPPSFYGTLARNIFGIGAGIVIGSAAIIFFPDAIAGAAIVARISPALARGYLNGVAATVGSHFFGKDPIDAYGKSILWSRYEADYRRRQLQ